MKAAVSIGLFALLATAIGCSTASLLKQDISQGEILYRQKCRNCHNLISPDKYSDEEWVLELEDMAVKASLTDGESRLIWEYLVSHN